MRVTITLLAVATISCWACSRASEPTAPEKPAAPTKVEPARVDPPTVKPALPPTIVLGPTNGWNDELLAIVGQYKSYTKMADDPNWGPMLCRPPWFTQPLISEAKTGSVHGRKLYFLWVKNTGSYPQDAFFDYVPEESPKMPQPVGQVVVKESFIPGKDANPDDSNAPRTLGAPSDFFIMFKADPATPGTDKGWVYGTVTSDGKTVTGAGLMENCMGCHKDAKHDRLFGMIKTAGRADTK